MFASFSSEHEHFTHGMYITALIRPSDVKNRTDHVIRRNGANVFVWGVSADILIIHTFLSAPACTDMVSSKELERDVTTNAMAKEPPRLKTLATFLHST